MTPTKEQIEQAGKTYSEQSDKYYHVHYEFIAGANWYASQMQQQGQKELKYITDDDVLYCAKLFNEDEGEWEVKDRTNDFVMCLCEMYQLWIWFDGYFLNVQTHMGSAVNTHGSIIQIIDYLRSKGYKI